MRHSLIRALIALSFISACTSPAPIVTDRTLPLGMIKIEATGSQDTSTRQIREGLLLRAAQATLDKGASHFVIADEVRGTRQVRKDTSRDFGIAPSFKILETSTRERMDLASAPVNYETVPQPFGTLTIEVFNTPPDSEPRTIYDAATVLSLSQHN